jgi:hypothetical protein
MTPVDDLKPGMFVAIVDREDSAPEPSGFTMVYSGFGETSYSRHSSPSSDGQPLEIIAMSLPFICVTDGKRRFAIDVRTTYLKKLDPRYVKAMTEEQREAEFTATRKRKKRESAEHDSSRCSRCGGRLVQRLVKPGSGEWLDFCPQCGGGTSPTTCSIPRN